MPYTVIRPFKDMRDEEQHEYKIDDVFPRKGYKPDQEFVTSLLTGFNSAGSIFITDEVMKKAEEAIEKVEATTQEAEEATEEAEETTEEVEEATEEKPKRKKVTKKEEE
ncbi:hypothetical protein [Streptococcus gordonii]|uniref:hypothetical protein n=1 Tax=Streptococcus gordonii TaxID=1302 RepID=UPI001C8C4167|nr:hypothetical protein [Streptococcus gordonii]MBX9096417.1 hypothetical protein [Streptococcus gordonii]